MDRTPAYIEDMLGAARELIEIAGGLTLEQFVTDRIRCLAAEKLFINMGEAASRVPEGEAISIPGVPWRQIIGLRNILAHQYEQVEHEVLYKTATGDLSPVVRALEDWLRKRP